MEFHEILQQLVYFYWSVKYGLEVKLSLLNEQETNTHFTFNNLFHEIQTTQTH